MVSFRLYNNTQEEKSVLFDNSIGGEKLCLISLSFFSESGLLMFVKNFT